MEKDITINQKQLTKEGYVIISSYFLDYCVEILGTGPAMLYIQLLNYCHKGKDLAWPTLATLGRKMQFTPKSITKFHQILLKHGLIKKINKRRTASGNYRRNIYQVIPIHRVKNTLSISKNFPYVEEKITPNLGKKLPTNNTNSNSTNSTAANRENAAANFKKLKEKGEEKMKAIRERMVELDFEKGFIDETLKEYSVEKIERKLDLLMERRNIKSPAGWLRTALRNDYRDEEQERYDEEPADQESQLIPHPHLNPPPSRGRRDGSLILSHSIRGRKFVDCPAQKEEEFKEGLETGSQLNPSKWTSREKALEAIGLIRDNLSLSVYPLSPGGKGTIAKLRGG